LDLSLGRGGGVAYSFFAIRPASNARRPASHAWRTAVAIFTGSFAAATAVLSSTPAAPSSMASATSLAVPTPASTITGTFTRSTIMRMFTGLRMPRPLPIGPPSGMTHAAPASSSRSDITRSSLV
jgi:hypothetical protein